VLNIPQTIRNQIAETGKMRHPLLERVFRLSDEDQADHALMTLANMQTNGQKTLTRLWIAAAPLWLENVVVSQFTRTNPDWKQVLPETLTIREACLIAWGVTY